MYQVLDFVHVSSAAADKKIWAGLSRTHALFQCTKYLYSAVHAATTSQRRRGDVSAISLMRRAFVAATSERCRSDVAALSQRRRR